MSKINIEVRYPSHQDDAKHYDTATLRKHYLVERIMAPDEINMCYSMFDRIIVGGAMPVAEKLTLTSPDILRSEYFTQRREVGVINVGGRGAVTVGSDRYELEFKEALYIGRGDRHIVFESLDAEHPAKFYFNSAPAHKEYPCKKVSKKDAIVMHMGSLEESNERTINRLLVNEVTPCCQLQMGMTPRTPPSATSWASPRRPATSGCTTSRPSSPPSGASTPPAPPATTHSSGACAARTRTTTIWTGAPPRTSANL